MSRDDLEAVIWEEAHRLSLRNPKDVRTAAMDRILAAADAFAAGDSDDVTLRRRQVLVRDGWRHPHDDRLLVSGLSGGSER